MSSLASHSSTVGNSPKARRRTRRIALTVAVEVSGHDVERSSFTASTTATNLNRNGAAFHLNRDLSLGSVVVVKNSRGARTSARIVAQVVTGDGVFMYGVEFVDQGDDVKDFWGIAFPLFRK